MGPLRKVRPIIDAVRREGDRAMLRRFTTGNSTLADLPRPASNSTASSFTPIAVPRGELQRALESLPAELRSSLEMARENIARFHKQDSDPLKRRGNPARRSLPAQEVRRCPSAGLYIPGGTAPLVSTVLMLGIPARLAGVARMPVCTPPGRGRQGGGSDLGRLRTGGHRRSLCRRRAQAIAALAYGTESVAKVDKIAGPGNMYVNAAKAEVSIDPAGATIDMLAGPSELMVIADRSANAAFVAADMLLAGRTRSESQVVPAHQRRRIACRSAG